MQLATLMVEQRLSEVSLLAVSVDTRSDSLSLVRRARVPSIVFLEDRNHRVIDRYGLLDYTLWAPVPYPATYVIDREGIVRWRFVEKDFRVRASPEDVLCALQRLERGETVGDCRIKTFEPGFSSPSK